MGIADKIKPELTTADFPIGMRVAFVTNYPEYMGRVAAGSTGVVVAGRKSYSALVAVKLDDGGTENVFPFRLTAAARVDLAKPLQSRCGYPAEIVHRFADGDGEACVLVMLKKPKGLQAHTLYADGRYLKDGKVHDLDLCNVPEKPKVNPKMIEVTPEQAVVLNVILRRIGGHPDGPRGLLCDAEGSLHDALVDAFPGLEHQSQEFALEKSRDSIYFHGYKERSAVAAAVAKLTPDPAELSQF